nr:MAG TPA: hypothetical protein [Caudoviricetes sp.]
MEKTEITLSSLYIDGSSLADLLEYVDNDTLSDAIYALNRDRAIQLKELINRYHKCGTQQKLIIQ